MGEGGGGRSEHAPRVVYETIGTLSNLDDEPSGRRPEVTSVSVLGLSIKLKPAVLLNSGEFWGETADQNRGGFEHMQMTQSVILFRHESLCVRFLRYSDRKLTNRTVIWKDNRLIVPVIRFKGFSSRFNILTEKFYVSNVAF